ncbi:hypothetical protein [Polyangium sorediatum]|uniref:Uncharacterized protein n=1 Tax=Polyangium sorediatum TaxID=889274 RepID=A0ABT6P2B8_9BACT|nr:hypothetical protein [Polyangium sorediatum]MDI1434751.1 hypothetical protein [Polyangium sorediatum]
MTGSARAESPLAIARGAVREGLAALEGFGDLLGSRRIGPRALAVALSEMVPACEALRASFVALELAFVATLASDLEAQDQARNLGTHAGACVAALSSAFSDGGSLSDARRRLALEASVRKHGAELRDTFALAEFFAAAVTPAPTELDLVDVLEQRFGANRATEEGVIRIAVEAPRPSWLVADRHVLGGLVELAAPIASRRGTVPARLGVARPPSGGLVVRLSPAPRNAAATRLVLSVTARGEVPSSLGIARVAARRAKLGLTIDAAAGIVSIESEREAT